jgi:uncharacterized protein YggT (Ycf19 family)
MVNLSLVFRALFSVIYILLVLTAIAPWLARSRTNSWVRPLYAATDWLLNPIRAGLPPEKIGMDVSPYVAIILLYLIQRTFF